MSRYTFEYKAGDDITLTFAVTDEAGDPVDLTGSTQRFAIAPLRGTSQVVSTETSPATAVITVTDEDAGAFEVAVDGDATADLIGVYRFEVEVQDSEGGRQTVAEGTITFTQQIIGAAD
jgi:hypothetical protein